jgi:hypothetical protein
MEKAEGPVPKAVSSSLCVLYDPVDGRIIHIHQTVVLAGAKAPGKTAVERKARALLQSRGVDASKAKALHVDRPKLRPDTHYEVDPRKGRLVAVRKIDLPGQPPQ